MKMQFLKRLDVQIIAPILVIAFLGAVLGGQIIKQRIVTHIDNNTKVEIQNFSNKLYFLAESNFRALFNQYGMDEKRFRQLEPIVQKETIAAIRLLLDKDTFYEVYILQDGKITPLTQQIRDASFFQHTLKEQTGKAHYKKRDFYYMKRMFLPWGWQLILIDDLKRHDKLISDNVDMIYTTIAGVVGFIIFFLVLVFYRGIKIPFRAIDRQLKSIQGGDFQINHIEASTEVEQIVGSLNQTAHIIQSREQEILDQLEYTSSILNAQASIEVIASPEEGLIQANDRFLQFFPQYTSLEEFRAEHDCVCDFFEKIDEPEYIYTDPEEKQYWAEPVINEPLREWKVAMQKERELHYFSVLANRIQYGEKSRDIIVLTDITEAENYRRHLEHRVQEQLEQNRQQDKYILEQERRFATSELLTNIAHQWRQPLNAIGINLAEITEIIDEEPLPKQEIKDLGERVLTILQELSETITLFTQFEKRRDEQAPFSLESCFILVQKLIVPYLEEKNITLSFPENQAITLHGNVNNMAEALLKIFHNMIRIAHENKIENPTIHINSEISDDKLILTIKDNLGGIHPDILPVIFDPYTTSEFKSQGKGLGMYIVRSIIEKGFNGDIFVQNDEEGAVFTIVVPTAEEVEK